MSVGQPTRDRTVTLRPVCNTAARCRPEWRPCNATPEGTLERRPSERVDGSPSALANVQWPSKGSRYPCAGPKSYRTTNTTHGLDRDIRGARKRFANVNEARTLFDERISRATSHCERIAVRWNDVAVPFPRNLLPVGALHNTPPVAAVAVLLPPPPRRLLTCPRGTNDFSHLSRSQSLVKRAGLHR